MTQVKQAANVRELWPLLFVRDMGRSLAFYVEGLGFEPVGKAKDAVGRVFWCRLKRQGASVMLQQAEAEDGPAEGRGRGVVFFFLCDDADAMHAELKARGVPVSEPATADYGMRQVELNDPDGYALCFESEVQTPGPTGRR